ncbi:heterokaryon incompatibility protein-domain-containing protein [Xylaria bambusicola]|uniref:heterokaryon incompatibility protein-domain-containing protein n=1 Tax=Xylaria bambusicola TaxID=326684 RepID=UPI0020079D70|nr:heterokaryon incompatibility protein-domain-containing protein [Xylaria bambusicola]KAI0520971.1 heterokaryon incompatibility protein-domain-containing protein [Xylaria bambusicola]
MASPRYLLHRYNGTQFSIVETNGHSYDYDIVSYCWGDPVDKYQYNHFREKGEDDGLDSEKDQIEGLKWNITINREKVKAFKKLMCFKDVDFMWVDSLCINKADKQQEAEELAKMFQYYKQARNCYLMMDMPELFDPQQISDDLKLLDHITSNIGGASLLVETMRLSPNLEERLQGWAKKPWISDVLSEAAAETSGMDISVMNCYNTCISQVKSIFENKYFTRVWTFQEMILGKNLHIIGVTENNLSSVGSLFKWMELARDCDDKAHKLYDWINDARIVKTASIGLVLRLILDDIDHLGALKKMVMSIDAARIDIINGGPQWWVENQKGISNIFSAIALTPRSCRDMEDLFRGLLGIFSGLFTPAEIDAEFTGNDMNKMSFTFFKRLSSRTGVAWTKLSVSSRQRGQWDWIPVVEQKRDPIEQYENAKLEAESDTEKEVEGAGVVELKKEPEPNHLKTDIFTGVVRLGYLRQSGVAKARGLTGLLGKPRKLMSVHLKEENPQFHFIFKGCNCGKSTGLFRREKIPTHDQPVAITGDETGRTLAECATILGCIMDPAGDALEYKRRLLHRLAPDWTMTDINAKPFQWPDRCVSGTYWASIQSPFDLPTHSMSMNYRFGAITSCGSRLAKGSTANISCEVRVNCGCTITAPFSLIFEALTAVSGSNLGGANARVDEEDRIFLSDGLGLVQVGDLGKTYNLMAFGGDLKFHTSWASSCRSSRKTVPQKLVQTAPPTGRALIKSDFTHGMMNVLRNYGYVETRSGNLLIYRDHPLARYKITGVCIDAKIQRKNEVMDQSGVPLTKGVRIK